MSEPEFSRPVRAETIGVSARSLEVAAEPQERAALARRFSLAQLNRLEAAVTLNRVNEDILARGRIEAEVVQSCVVTDEAVPSRISEDFELLFRAHFEANGPEEEIELAEGELDVIFYDGALVDVGEAVAQTLALNLDPYPRAPGAAGALKEAGVMDEGEAGPFGALAALKDKLEP